MIVRAIFSAIFLATAGGMPTLAQDTAPLVPEEAPRPQTFTSAAQARAYLARNPTGPRAEAAFRTVVASEIGAANPEFDMSQVALDTAIAITPGATITPEEVQSIINQTTPEIGNRAGWF